MRKILTIFVFIHLSITFSLAQGGTDEQDRAREQVYRDANARSRDPEQTQKVPSGLPKWNLKLSADDQLKLTPPLEDSARYAQFLKNRKTGIIKLFEYLNCDRRVINVNDTNCLDAPQIIGNGSNYSFSARSHSFNRSIDIALIDGKFSYPNNLILLTELGDVALESYDFSKDAKALKKFSIKKEMSEISIQKKQFAEGVEIAGRTYKNRVSAKADTTYLLRSGKSRYVFGSGVVFSEITVAFRVIRQENDGSIVLVWKEL